MVTLKVKVTTNSPSQDYTHPDDHNLRTYDILILFIIPVMIFKSKTRENNIFLVTHHAGKSV